MLPFLGPRTLDSGFWTGLTLHTYHYLRPDAGPRTPDSGPVTHPLLTNLPPPPSKYLLTCYGADGFSPQTPETRNSELANLFQSWRWRCAHAAGVVLNVSRMSERRCTQQGCLPSAHDLEIPEDLRHYARRHLPGSVCSRAGRPSTRLRSRGPSRARA